MTDERINLNRDQRRVLPSQPCHSCECWTELRELQANDGMCHQCAEELREIQKRIDARVESEARNGR
jgi:hypothetical protein